MPPVQLDPRVPPALSNVILRGLAKQPGDRYQTAGEFRAALGQVFQQPQAQPHPQPQPQQQAQPQPQVQAPVYQEPPAAPAPAKSPRTLYMLAGSLATVAVAAVLITQAPKFLRTNAQQPPVVTEQPNQEPPPVTQQQPQTQTPDMPPQTQQQQQPASQVSIPRLPAATGTPTSHGAASIPSQQSQIPQPQRETPPPPQQQQAQTPPPAPQPQAPAVDRGALDEQRKRVIQMAQRIVTAKAAYQQLRESMAQQGLRPRADLQGSTQRMQFEMDQAEAALNSGNAGQAKQHLDYAERALEAVEKALNL